MRMNVVVFISDDVPDAHGVQLPIANLLIEKVTMPLLLNGNPEQVIGEVHNIRKEGNCVLADMNLTTLCESLLQTEKLYPSIGFSIEKCTRNDNTIHVDQSRLVSVALGKNQNVDPRIKEIE